MEPNPYQSPQTADPAAQTEYVKPTMKELLLSFDGRIPRRVYWGIALGSMAVFYGITIPLTMISEGLGSIVMLLLFIPFMWVSLAANIKRWHDRDKSGWWVLIGFIPIVGAIWSLVECGCLRGTIGNNTYGPDPT